VREEMEQYLYLKIKAKANASSTTTGDWRHHHQKRIIMIGALYVTPLFIRV
jgi:hypothetical protein